MAKVNIPDEGTLVTMEQLVPILDKYFAAQMEAIKKIGAVTIPNIPSIPDKEPVKDPIRTLPKCKAGPSIKTAVKKSAQRLAVSFHGEDVFQIKPVVLNPAGKNIVKDVLSSATNQSRVIKNSQDFTFEPDNNEPVIALTESLVDGAKYKVIFTSVLCDGESSFFFESAVSAAPVEQPCKPEGRITKVELTNL